MILPFVREIFAELEQSSSFDRVRRHLCLGVGRQTCVRTHEYRTVALPSTACPGRQTTGHRGCCGQQGRRGSGICPPRRLRPDRSHRSRPGRSPARPRRPAVRESLAPPRRAGAACRRSLQTRYGSCVDSDCARGIRRASPLSSRLLCEPRRHHSPRRRNRRRSPHRPSCQRRLHPDGSRGNARPVHAPGRNS